MVGPDAVLAPLGRLTRRPASLTDSATPGSVRRDAGQQEQSNGVLSLTTVSFRVMPATSKMPPPTLKRT